MSVDPREVLLGIDLDEFEGTLAGRRAQRGRRPT